jgi:hypothetical protein
MEVRWNRVVDLAPEQDQECLVWTGRYMFVSRANVFSAEEILALKEIMGVEYAMMVRKSKGQFSDIGMKYYFDDPDIFWTELPNPPEGK